MVLKVNSLDRCAAIENKVIFQIEKNKLADIVAVNGDPLLDIKIMGKVSFVMKDGEVFKKDGVMTPEKFLHGGPVNGYNIR